MAKPKLPAKAWLLPEYHEWYKQDRGKESAAKEVHVVDVISEDHNRYECQSWACGMNVPKEYIQFLTQDELNDMLVRRDSRVLYTQTPPSWLPYRS